MEKGLGMGKGGEGNDPHIPSVVMSMAIGLNGNLEI